MTRTSVALQRLQAAGHAAGGAMTSGYGTLRAGLSPKRSAPSSAMALTRGVTSAGGRNASFFDPGPSVAVTWSAGTHAADDALPGVPRAAAIASPAPQGRISDPPPSRAASDARVMVVNA